jgi:hypothetical protein
LIDLFWFNVRHPEGICRQEKHNQQNKTLDKNNPPPLTVSCAPSGDEGPTVYIQKERKKKQPVPRADKKPGGLSNLPPYT